MAHPTMGRVVKSKTWPSEIRYTEQWRYLTRRLKGSTYV